MVRLRVRYRRPSDLVADYDQQLVRGGLLVRVAPPPDLNPFDPVELELVAAGGALLFAAEVLQVFPNVGVAVKLDAATVPELAAGVEHARAHLDANGEPPLHEIVASDAPHATGLTEPPPRGPSPSRRPAAPRPEALEGAIPEEAADAPPPEATPAPRARPDDNPAALAARIQAASGPEKIQIAASGTREERALILRDVNKAIHTHVLRNPGLQADEVLGFAKMTNVSSDFLDALASKREWSQRPNIAFALVRNPKTPITTAVRLLEHVTPADLRQIAKDAHTRAQIQSAARKKLA